MLDPAPDVHNPTEAHNDAMGLPMEDVIRRLVDLLGATTVAAIGNVKETRAVTQWLSGEREPQRPHALRFALQLALMISNHTTRDIARAWFHGSNPHLEDRSPLALLRDDPLEEAQAPLISGSADLFGPQRHGAAFQLKQQGKSRPTGACFPSYSQLRHRCS